MRCHQCLFVYIWLIGSVNNWDRLRAMYLMCMKTIAPPSCKVIFILSSLHRSTPDTPDSRSVRFRPRTFHPLNIFGMSNWSPANSVSPPTGGFLKLQRKSPERIDYADWHIFQPWGPAATGNERSPCMTNWKLKYRRQKVTIWWSTKYGGVAGCRLFGVKAFNTRCKVFNSFWQSYNYYT